MFVNKTHTIMNFTLRCWLQKHGVVPPTCIHAASCGFSSACLGSSPMPAGLGSTLLLLPVSAQHCCFVGSVGWTAAVLARFRLMMVASMVSSRKSGRCRLHSLLKGVSAVQSMMRLLRLSRSEWKEKIALRYFMASRQTQRLLIRWCLHQSERGNGMMQELCGTVQIQTSDA